MIKKVLFWALVISLFFGSAFSKRLEGTISGNILKSLLMVALIFVSVVMMIGQPSLEDIKWRHIRQPFLLGLIICILFLGSIKLYTLIAGGI